MHKQRGMALWALLGVGILALGAVSIVGTVVWNHFDNIATLERTVREQGTAIAKHEANAAQYKATIESRDRQIDNLREANATVQKHRDEADRKFAEARAQAEYVKRIFADHDFEKLAKAKPGLISKRMQRGTANVFSEIEDVANSF
jgi:multidrug resistance efflux pump